MKYKVGDTGDEIEIGQYREVNKGSLKAFFSLVIYSPPPYVKADKSLDCRYFVQGNSRWFSFPSKKVEYTDGRPPEFIPLRCYMDKEYLEQLKQATLTALKEAKPEGNHGNMQAPQNKSNPTSSPRPVQVEASSNWGNPPF